MSTDESGSNVIEIGGAPQFGSPAEAVQLINEAEFAMLVTVRNGQWFWRIAKGQANKFQILGALQQMIQVVAVTR
jgi:hypothetical protein